MHKTFMHKKGAKRIALSCAALLALSSGGTVLAAEATAVPISAALGTGLSYEFTGADAGKRVLYPFLLPQMRPIICTGATIQVRLAGTIRLRH